MFTQSGANAGLSLIQQSHAFAHRQYLKPCDKWAYLNREKLAEPSRLVVWRATGGIERPWKSLLGVKYHLQAKTYTRMRRLLLGFNEWPAFCAGSVMEHGIVEDRGHAPPLPGKLPPLHLDHFNHQGA